MKVIEIVKKIKAKEISAQEVLDFYLKKIEEKNSLNAVIEVFSSAKQLAKEVDDKIKEGKPVGKLAGVPILIKDNILYKDHKASCGSKFLKDYIAQYSSTVVKKLLKEDAVIIGRANMDEFAMGSTNKTSFYGPCKNAVNENYVAGGSSGGSACAVASGIVPCALGTDTGGSIRQPSSYNGVVGLKPTYGRVSRYGIIAFASSLDQVGPITQDVSDNALILSVLAGKDEHDETSLNEEPSNYLDACNKEKPNFTIGIVKQIDELFNESGKRNENFEKAVQWCKEQGFNVTTIDIPNIKLCLPVYYILSPAEATSNLARFDGIKYSRRAEDAKNLDEIYVKSRTEGFGEEVKRRIMLGNFVLNSGYFDAYYNKAKKIQQLAKKEFNEAFKNCDIILMPTTYGEALKMDQKTTPVELYMEDIFTIPANIASLPAISVPCGEGLNGMPIGLQVISARLNEDKIYAFASYFEANYLKGGRN